ncbi:MAG: MBL fold metallo-hydrolase, partial [Planctomycetota bacterium]|nr:MBL fold metallo-hydrolase [Planctomycetota bacterium]
MPIRLHFLGAARNVTGSRYVLASERGRLLIDCGLYQERAFLERNWAAFPLPPASLAAAVLSHCHLDHCGWLPRLMAGGFRGQAFCTSATAELAALILEDSGRIQEEDARFKAKRHSREGRTGPHGPARPLYTCEEAERAAKRLQPLPRDKAAAVAPDMQVMLREAGHVLGSAAILVEVSDGSRRCRVLFSGDMGGWQRPLLPESAPAPAADHVVIESTYG